MKVSLNTVKQYIDFELPPVAELVGRINMQLGGVEEVIDLREKYAGPVIVKVVECVDHPDSDHMHVCRVDDGGAVQGVERGDDGLVQVVCGAPNVHAGMLAAWLPPESTVPNSFDEPERFVLGSRQLRGVMSHGMLASPRELALGDDHDGILEIDPTEWKPSGVEITPGVKFADCYGLDDTVIDIENKMFTHRPDCFGQLGVAREIAGIFGHKFSDPEWYWMMPQFKPAEGLQLTVANDAGSEKVPRFMAVAIKEVTVGPSPVWLRAELVRMGGKPLGNIVDITNYVMLLTGQPTHAYDYDKLRGHMLGTRMAHSGEQAVFLNNKTYTLTPEDIVIVDGEGVVGLAGVIGGSGSEVSTDTKNIVLEVATFDMFSIRKTSMRHGIFTDAVTRFSKGQSPLQNDRILQLLMQSVTREAGGVQASDVFDFDSTTVDGLQNINREIPTTEKFINERLGLSLGEEEICGLLRNVHFACYSETPGNLMIAAPFWRTDIVDPEDIVEEIGRLYGFEKLPRELPRRSISPAPKNRKMEMKLKIGQILSEAGVNEVKTYSFVHENLLKKTGQDPTQAFRLGNALSPDLQYYRLSVLPSLLDKVHPNIKAGHDEFALFEIGKAHNKKYHADDDDGLPRELEMVDIVYASKKPHDGAAFYRVRRMVDELARGLKLRVCYQPADETMDFPLTAPFDLKRSAFVSAVTDAEPVFIGMVGELKNSVMKALKLPEYTAAASLDLEGLLQAVQRAGVSYTPLSRFPSVTQDVTLKVNAETPLEDLSVVVKKAAADALAADGDADMEITSIYQPENSGKKSVTFRVKAVSYERTLTDKEVSGYVGSIVEAARAAFDAEQA